MKLKKITLATASLGLTLAVTHAGIANAAGQTAADAKTQALEEQIDSLAQQLNALKAELNQVKAQNQAIAAQQTEIATRVATPSPMENLSLWGYGEAYYSKPIHDNAKSQADLARAVFGIGYRFDEKTTFNSEFEIEHAIASSEDAGEMEVEQFYVDHQINNSIAVKAGLFLIPSGLLNLKHEPTHFFGVQRNFVETFIIPATWREGGVGVHGNTDLGIGWDVGVTTGVNLAGRDAATGLRAATALDLGNSGAGPLAATHQELSLANASNLSQYLALGYKGIPGLDVGASVFTGKAATQDPTVNLGGQRVTLWEAHSRWTPAKFDLSALYARGTISNTGAYNALTPGAPNPTPSAFNGWYVQGAYNVWQNSTYRLAPFMRWEYYNMGESFAGLVPGFEPPQAGDRNLSDHVYTAGLNFYVTPNVVLKADYQTFSINEDLSRLELGLGVAF